MISDLPKTVNALTREMKRSAVRAHPLAEGQAGIDFSGGDIPRLRRQDAVNALNALLNEFGDDTGIHWRFRSRRPCIFAAESG